MKILVAGSAGFIGYPLCEKLCALGHKVVGVDNYSLSYSPKIKQLKTERLLENDNFIFIEADIANQFSIDKVFRANKGIDLIINLASLETSERDSNYPIDVITTHVIGTTNLLESAKKYKIDRFILGSASSVYGDTKKIPFLESHPYTRPLNSYAASKLAAESLVEVYSYNYGIKAISFRIFSTYGPDMPPKRGIYKFIDEGYKKGTIEKLYTGAARDYIYVDDVVDGIVSSLKKRLTYQVINLCSGVSYTNEEIVEKLSVVMNKKVKTMKLKTPNSILSETLGSTEKAKKMLGFLPKIDIETGLYKTFQWYLKEIAAVQGRG